MNLKCKSRRKKPNFASRLYKFSLHPWSWMIFFNTDIPFGKKHKSFHSICWSPLLLHFYQLLLKFLFAFCRWRLVQKAVSISLFWFYVSLSSLSLVSYFPIDSWVTRFKSNTHDDFSEQNCFSGSQRKIGSNNGYFTANTRVIKWIWSRK